MTITECDEVECPNFNRTLTNFITMERRNEGYCKDHSCNFSTNYDQNYTIACYYFRNTQLHVTTLGIMVNLGNF